MSRRAWTLFIAQSVIWGVPYLFIKVAVDDGVTPEFLAWARILLAALVLMPLAWRAGVLAPLRGRLRWVALFAVIELAIPFPLLGFGEQRIESSLAAILIAATPILVALIAIRFDQGERATGKRALGLAIGFAGVVALVGIDIAGSSEELIGALAIGGVAVGYAIGPMILKRKFGEVDSRAAMGTSMVIAALALTPFAAAGAPTEVPPTEALVAIAVLGIICTALAFVIWGELIREVGPGRALVVTYVNPLVAVAAGTIFLSEQPGPGAIVGLALILAGSWLATANSGLSAGIDRAGPSTYGRWKRPSQNGKR